MKITVNPYFALCLSVVIVSVLAGCSQHESSPPYSPQDALGTFQLPEGYRIELVASEPLITDPVDMAFDPEGLLYVAEMEDYPASGAPGGRIMLLEDKDQNGHFESGTVFAENLPYVNGVMPWRKGVLVTSAPDILYLEDSTGDGRADIRRVVLTGFALTNPQLRMSSLRYGLNNWIYGAYSRAAGQRGYPEFTNHGNPLTFPDNPVRDSADIYPGNDFRFLPEDFKVEPAGGMSQFGMAFDAAGNRFTVWNNVHLRHVVIDGRYLTRNPWLSPGSAMASVSDHGDAAPVYSKAKNRLDLHESEMGHFTSACGHTVYTGDIFGPDYQGAAFVCEPVSNLVHADRLTPKGATFTGKRLDDKVEFLTSTDSWFRPVNTTVGPDGALYVVDFYRKLVEHPAWIARADDKGMYTHAGLLQESDFLEGNDRGRIYRIAPENYVYSADSRPALKTADTKTLVDHLDHPNLWWRTNAQRLLVERQDSSAISALKKLWSASPSPEGKIHTLWTLEGLGQLTDALVISALSDDHPTVRKQAVLLAERRLSNPRVHDKILSMTQDADDHVQFQVLLTLGERSDPRSLDAMRQIAESHLADPWFRNALLLSAGDNALAWYHTVREFDLSAKEPISAFLQILASITGARQDSREISTLVSLLSVEKDSTFQLAGLRGLNEGMLQGKGLLKLSSAAQNNLLILIRSPAPRVQDAALEMAEKVRIEKSPAVRSTIDHALKIALQNDAPADIRAREVRILALDRGQLRTDVFDQLLQPKQPEPVQLAAARVLAGREDTVSMRMLLQRWNVFTPDVREVVENGFTNALKPVSFLLAAVEKGRIEPSWLSRTTRSRLTQHANNDIRMRSEKLLGTLSDEKREEVVTAFYESTTLAGDPLKGKAVFEKSCSTCHHLEGVGRQIGPDLLSVTNQTRINLLTMILNPNNNISPGYDGYIVDTSDGRTFAGIMGNETATAVVLRTLDGKEQMVARENIRTIRPMSASLMPDGLESGLSVQDVADLLEYLKNP